MSQEVNGHIIREKIPNITLGANAAIGTAAATVDIVSHVGVIASAPGLTFTLPTPTDTRSGLDFRVTNAGTNTFTIGSKAIGLNSYADFSWDNGAWHNEAQSDLYRDRGMPNVLMTLSGVATYTRPNFLSWTRRFIILGGGRGPDTTSTDGFYDIVMPPVGTVIPGVALAQDVTVTAEGINLRDIFSLWTALYYILPPTGNVSVPTNFRMVGYRSDFAIPDNWVLVAVYNADILTIKLGTGQILKQGTDTTGFVAPFDAIVDFNQLTPTTPGVVFTPNNPANDTVLYVSSVNASQWFWNGTAYVSAPVSADWKITGNVGTVQATNFLGTADDVGLSFRTRNQIRQTITNVGDVGIGITVPLSRLSIAGGNNEIGFYQGGLNQGKQAVIKVQSPADGDGHLAFETYRGGFGGGERMRITRSGDVGIATTTPLNKLHIGAATVPNTGGIRLPITSASGAQTGQPIGVDANGDIVRLASASFDATVDFNQTTPTNPGAVFTPNNAASTTVLYVSTIDGSQWTYNGITYVAAPVSNDWQTRGNTGTVQATNFVGTTDNAGLSFRTNNAIRQTISATGNVGIGAVTPFAKLHVALGSSNASPASWDPNHVVFANGSAANSSGLGIGYNTATNEAWISTLTPGTSWRPMRFHGTAWRFFTNGTTEAFTIAPNSNVGVNQTAPTNKLHVANNGSNYSPNVNDQASIKVEGSYGGGIVFAEGANRAAIFSEAGSGLNFCTGGTVAGTPQRMTISAAGNLGVGTTGPTQKLEVAGNIRATAVANYASTAAAIADAALLAGTFYTVTLAGAKQLYVK